MSVENLVASVWGHRLYTLWMSKDPTKFVGGSEAPQEAGDDVLLIDNALACVVILNGRQRGHEFSLAEGTHRIGRDNGVEIWVHDDSMSRRHAAVIVDGGHFVLRDLDSTNGTWLDGLLKGTEKELSDGDRFKVGETEFRFFAPGSRPEQPVEVGVRPPPAEKQRARGPELSEPAPQDDEGLMSTGERRATFGDMDDLADTSGFSDRPVEEKIASLETSDIEPIDDD